VSFILDALKKSENERQRQGGPGFADVPLGRVRQSRPWWIVAVGALLLANLVVLTIVLARRQPDAPVARPAVATAPSTPTGSSSVNPTAIAPAPAPPPPSAATAPTATPAVTVVTSMNVPVTQPAGAGPGARPPVPTTPAAAASSSLAEAAGAYDPQAYEDPTLAYDEFESAAATVPDGRAMVTSRAGAARAAATETLPTVTDLNLSGSAALPELHLDIHVYAMNAADRFVFINMHKYVEGQQLAEGPTVERITRDGVVLNQRGIRFVLPRQ
jgi:general secretion pathway protein B